MKKNKKEARSWIPNGKDASVMTQESFNTIRTNLRFSTVDKEGANVIGVTSSFPAEGKSYCSINIAYSIARSGSRVLLMEGDLRKPTLAYKLKMRGNAAKGLTDLLCGMTNVKEAIIKSNLHENLDVMFSGDVPPNPQELLGSNRMLKLVEALSNAYDYIIIDLPPVISVSDALSLAGCLDGVVVVVRENVSQKRILKESVKQIQYAGIKILGFIFNDVNIEKNTYYGKYYGYGYYTSSSK